MWQKLTLIVQLSLGVVGFLLVFGFVYILLKPFAGRWYKAFKDAIKLHKEIKKLQFRLEDDPLACVYILATSDIPTQKLNDVAWNLKGLRRKFDSLQIVRISFMSMHLRNYEDD